MKRHSDDESTMRDHSERRELKVSCPCCGKKTDYYGNPDRPFCSALCAAVDLGNWGEEKYRIPSKEKAFQQDDLPEDQEESF